jgi:DNA-binding Lrp family transcriptional regulator
MVNIMGNTNFPTKKKSTNMTLGSKKMIDPDTGELVDFTLIQKNVNKDYNFHKIWLQDILHVLDSFGNKKIKIVTFLLQEMRDGDNTVSVTHSYIQEKTGISRQTISETMKELVGANVIKKIRHGTYQFNPDLIIKGDGNKKKHLLISYNYGDDSTSISHSEELKTIENLAEKFKKQDEKNNINDDIVDVELQDEIEYESEEEDMKSFEDYDDDEIDAMLMENRDKANSSKNNTIPSKEKMGSNLDKEIELQELKNKELELENEKLKLQIELARLNSK